MSGIYISGTGGQTMTEYIDRTAIVQKIKNRYLPRSVDPYSVNLYDAGVNCGLDLALGLIDSAISEDVMPVKRCKDCTHWEPNDETGGFCKHLETIIENPDFFCAAGTKMDEVTA